MPAIAARLDGTDEEQTAHLQTGLFRLLGRGPGYEPLGSSPFDRRAFRPEGLSGLAAAGLTCGEYLRFASAGGGNELFRWPHAGSLHSAVPVPRGDDSDRTCRLW